MLFNCLFLVPLLLLYSYLKEKNAVLLNGLIDVPQRRAASEYITTRTTQPLSILNKKQLQITVTAIRKGFNIKASQQILS